MRHVLRRVVALVATGAAAFALSTVPAEASWFTATTGPDGANIRDCYHPPRYPSTTCPKVVLVPAHTTVHIVCQEVGEVVNNDSVWDYITWDTSTGRKEGFAANFNLNTPGSESYWIFGLDECDT
jgi:hypothetical protein